MGERRDAGAAARPRVTGFAAAAAIVGVATLVGRVAFRTAVHLPDVVMVYLLGVVMVSVGFGRWPSLFATLLAVVALDFFFIPPFGTLAVADTTHLTTFAVMFIVAAIASGLTKRVRDQAEAARERELRTASLYSLSDALARAETTDAVALAGARHVEDVFGAPARVLLGEDARVVDDLDTRLALDRVGVLDVRLPEDFFGDPARRRHLEAFARQIAGALERTRLAEAARRAQLRVETEQLRNALLSSVSHDLRTPLAVITGAASALLDKKLGAHARAELTQTVLVEAERLNRLVRNLLDMTRLEAGAVQVNKEWQTIEEAVGAALERVEHVIGSRPIATTLDPALPLVPYDSVLLQQVLVNLLENAAKYTPDESEITLTATVAAPDIVEIVVADRGPGLAPGEEEAVFAKFYRGARGRGGGVGLGLAICKGIVAAHGGRIWASARAGGGAELHFTLPIEGTPPSLDLRGEEDSA